jgi:hypothetical protein
MKPAAGEFRDLDRAVAGEASAVTEPPPERAAPGPTPPRRRARRFVPAPRHAGAPQDPECIRAGRLRCGAMAAIAGRRRRTSSEGGIHVLLQGRVDPDIKERAHRGAAVRGVSIARYLEILVEGDELADTYVKPGECEQLDLGMSA